MVKIISWNVNGLRSRIIDNLDASKFTEKTKIDSNSNLGQLVEEFDPDIICFSETRCSTETMQKFKIDGFYNYFNSSSKTEKGRTGDRYSGVAIWTKIKPNDYSLTLPTLTQPDIEGRIITLYFNNFILINTYVPNAGSNFDYRITQWDPAMAEYLQILARECPDIPIIWTGDLNIARTPHDVFFGDLKHHYPNKNQTQLQTLAQNFYQTPLMQGIGPSALAGFTREERDNFSDLLALGFTDVWRYLHPNLKHDGYTWWNMRIPPQRKANKGWRIDYFVIDNQHLNLVESCRVFKHIGEATKENKLINKLGSDHCPIGLDIRLS